MGERALSERVRDALKLALEVLEADLATFEHDTPPSLWTGKVRLRDLHCDIDRYRECQAIMRAIRKVRTVLSADPLASLRSDGEG